MSLLEDLHEGYLLQNADKEKEPATAATVTDSMDTKTGVCDTVSASNHIIDPDRCQVALRKTKKELALIYERLGDSQQHAWDLGELFYEVCSALGEEEE